MIAKAESRTPWSYVPTTYFAEGLPWVVVNTLAVIIFKKMGVSNTEIAAWTSLLYLPWVIKMFWGPLVDMYSTRRKWITWTQGLIAVGLIAAALSLKTPYFLYLATACFMLVAFLSATHDIAVDGFYMLSMSEEKQAFFVGIRAFCYRLAILFTTGGLVVWAGLIEARTGNIPLSWQVTLLAAAGILGLLALYHKLFLPYPAADAPREKGIDWGEFFRVFAAYFRLEGIGVGIAFILLYRFGEAMLLKLAAPFLLDKAGAGGLALSTTNFGYVYGTVGLICLIAGSILGGMIIARYGLRRTIWPLAFMLNAPDLFYVYMAYNTDLPLSFVGVLVALEQFGFGLGTTAFMFFLIQLTGEKYKTAHFAISTGIMALGMMLPGFVSGWLQERVGYPEFFIIVCFATLPGMLLIPFLKIKA
ncbi:MAG: major facilitator superfamily protein [Elusimicrobia bacterium]|nr:MAG: major facilitator superfamily protein [Elusimicrobiota bacterium]KAF0158430.1 MAG: major facilitator superfamily protein [Elusimicrobiota bacterium]